MATAKDLRTIIIRCAKDATEREPNDKNYRARLFAAYLSGRAEALGELDLMKAIDAMLGLDRKPADGA